MANGALRVPESKTFSRFFYVFTIKLVPGPTIRPVHKQRGLDLWNFLFQMRNSNGASCFTSKAVSLPRDFWGRFPFSVFLNPVHLVIKRRDKRGSTLLYINAATAIIYYCYNYYDYINNADAYSANSYV